MQESIDWDKLYPVMRPKLMAYFQVRVATKQQAEDFVSLTFSRAWRRRYQYQSERGTPEAWLFGIARYFLIDFLRRNDPLTVPLESGDSIEKIIERQETYETLKTLLDTLSSRESEILKLRYGQQMRIGDIAQEMGLSEANVAKIVSRTLTKLRRIWDLDSLIRYVSGE
jgi:RNA polymerase sigma factor (sigma-70 family)